ncbi:c-type cytochrome [Sinorhizobium mexicanum]|uniref:Cytochrome c n=1 Tax=Sinorhizobium mexicanum TaxID=375549 RepID=A0A859QX28_9HYPH|nr:cytochrome c [Sinorhizobium mexicanum]MBP1884308.1 cytochrome c oxidase cbb3-type subunit 3 [Sinorhizobium mexicanum]QLL64996.1 cytochrome c [Sinorhizobium mexicanum]
MPGKVLKASAAHPLAAVLLFSSLVGLSALTGWERQPRQYRTDPPVAVALNQLRLMPSGIGGAPPEIYFALDTPYETSAYDLSQGKRLYSWFGCASCHGDGRGGAGPSLLDGWWLYGPSVVAIAASIRDGRPRGMPAFSNRMTTDQVWQLAGYVKTIGAYSASLAAPSRNDDKHTRPAENRAPAAILFDEAPPVPVLSEQGPPS